NHFEASGQGFHSDRYLDPPVLENYTNLGNGNGLSVAYEHDFSERDRLRFTFIRNKSRHAVPNERVQQAAGQRQDASNAETSGQIYYQHISSDHLLWTSLGACAMPALTCYRTLSPFQSSFRRIAATAKPTCGRMSLGTPVITTGKWE